MTYTSTEDTEDMRLVSKRRKDMAAWAVENFKTWPKPHELTDVDPEEIGCELVVLNQHHLPVLRCKLGGGYVDSTTWFYAKRNPKKMTQAQQPEALRLAHTLIGGKLIDDSTEWADTLHAAAAELCRQHARIEELEAQLEAIGAGGVEPLRKSAAAPAPNERAEFEARFKHLDLTQEPDLWGAPRYKHAAIWLAWEAWQAARRAQVVLVPQGMEQDAAQAKQGDM